MGSGTAPTSRRRSETTHVSEDHVGRCAIRAVSDRGGNTHKRHNTEHIDLGAMILVDGRVGIKGGLEEKRKGFT